MQHTNDDRLQGVVVLDWGIADRVVSQAALIVIQAVIGAADQRVLRAL